MWRYFFAKNIFQTDSSNLVFSMKVTKVAYMSNIVIFFTVIVSTEHLHLLSRTLYDL